MLRKVTGILRKAKGPALCSVSVKWMKDLKLVFFIKGTSDEHITVMENLRQVPQCSAILVTTPQQVAIEDVRKEITFCRKTGIPIMGIIENMSG